MNFNVTIDVNPVDFVCENSRASVKAFILELDSEVGELDFTTELIESLVQLAKGDMTPKDSVELIDKLKKTLGV